MNWDEIAGNWKQIKGTVKESWGKLTANDLTAIAGQWDQLAGVLQQKYGYSRGQSDKELTEFPQGLIPVTISKSSQGRS